MAGRHQAQYTRYASSSMPYGGVGSSGNNLNVPFPAQNNGTQSTGVAGYSSQPTYNTNNAANMTSPYSTSSSPGHHPSPQMRPVHSQPLRKYTLQPPPRSQPYNRAMPSLGYPGLYPQKPKQDEDTLTETNVRNGFIDRPAVSNESTSAHDMVYGKLQDDHRTLNDLGAFAVDVMRRKREASKITGPSTFRPPVRTTMIEAKKEQWMHELAAGVVPLRKLARSVPHGYKGEKLLEVLAARQVPFLRATWFIKIVGLSEMNQRQANNNQGTHTHAFQWTSVVTSHLKRQLNELLPVAPPQHGAQANNSRHRANAPNHHENAQRPWATPETRARFEQRWTYSTRLTRWQYCEGLLDQRSFIRWTLDSLAACNTFEMMWLLLTFIVQDYVEEYRRNRTLMRMLIETLIKVYGALLQSSSLIQTDGPHGVYRNLKRSIEHTLQSLFLSTPDVFVMPKLYHQYRHLFDTIFGPETLQEASETLPDICEVMQRYWAMVKARNEVFCGTLEANQIRMNQINGVQDSPAPATGTIGVPEMTTSTEAREPGESPIQPANEDHIIRVLDNIGRYVDSRAGLKMSGQGWVSARGQTAASAAAAIFGNSNVSQASLRTIIDTMCRWATCDFRHGDWRPYLITSILKYWRDQEPGEQRTYALQDALIQWLDTEIGLGSNDEEEDEEMVDVSTEGILAESPRPATVFLFDTLIRLRLFSYQKFLLRLIARGDLEPRKRQRRRTLRCFSYLASFPLASSAPKFLLNQRRVALHGTRKDGASQIETDTVLKLKRLSKCAVARSVEEANADGDVERLFGQDAKNLTQPDQDETIDADRLLLSDAVEREIKGVLQSTTRYAILNFTSEWLVPEVKRFVVKNIPIREDNWRVMTSPGSSLLNVRQYVTIIRILETAQDYLGAIDMALWVLEKTNERPVYTYAIDTLRKHASIWKLTNMGEQVGQAAWAKHQALHSRGTREQYLMMFMIELLQEGYQISDEARTQLSQDLHYKPKTRGTYRNNLLPTELTEIVKNPTASVVQLAVENVCAQPQNDAGWLQTVFNATYDTLRRWVSEHPIQDEAARYEVRRRLCALLDFVKDTANSASLTGQLDDVICQWLDQHCNPSHSTPAFAEMSQSGSWAPLFLSLLATRSLVGIDTLLQRFILPWLERISHEVNQRCETQWTENTTDTEHLRHLCKNMIALTRMLIIQERPEGGMWTLRSDELYRIDTLRPSLSVSLDKLDLLFGLVRHSLVISANLPLSSLLIQDLASLRSDLLQVDWLRRACSRDVNNVYRHFATSNIVGEGDIKKKMLCIVDELIGESMQLDQDVVAEAPSFPDRLHSVFENLSQWNEEQCRVQLNLLLDNMMVTQPAEENGNGMAMDISPAPAASETRDLDFFVKFLFDTALASSGHSRSPNEQRRFDFLINLIHGLRQPTLLALLQYGVHLLEGNPDAPFPESILLIQPDESTPRARRSEQYAQKCQAFFFIMQYLLAKEVWNNEQKIQLVKSLYRQIGLFKAGLLVYRVMENTPHVSYAEAARALQTNKNDVELATAALKAEGIPDTPEPAVLLPDLRLNLLLRLRLIVPFASLIWEHPEEAECDILGWINILVSLLGNPIVHGNGSQEHFFEFALDLVSLLIDELPPTLRKEKFGHLSSMQGELNFMPPVLRCRVKRILPFLTHNIYLSNTRFASALLGLPAATDPQHHQQHLEACIEQSKPWEWLEDYVGDQKHDNDTPISLSLFRARKAKRTENTHIRWYRFSEKDMMMPINEDGDLGRVGMVGYRNKRRKKETGIPEEGSQTNGLVYKAEDAGVANLQQESQQQQQQQQQQQAPSISSSSGSTGPPQQLHPQHQQSSSSARQADMEEGELP